MEESYRQIKEFLPELGRGYFEMLCENANTTDCEKLTDMILSGQGLPECMVDVPQDTKEKITVR